ncbi:MAG: hypothetical protein BWX89_01187 [candidate division TA06 bacterium ADurb.Bin131]|uniref:Uncharacterized protein n=1 Tax=candidate division TA06 bacterium ADurb.Bin131 TaxID=1852827 RepID=A0A1V6C7M7_UNCT6|nr:MAG: hypothetical protein BWX89_01187 [candidate division TA06 bacterium ADurb.Bin131]
MKVVNFGFCNLHSPFELYDKVKIPIQRRYFDKQVNQVLSYRVDFAIEL